MIPATLKIKNPLKAGRNTKGKSDGAVAVRVPRQRDGIVVKVAKPLRISTEFSHELAWEFRPLPTLPSARQFARSDGLLEGSLKTGSTGNTPQ